MGTSSFQARIARIEEAQKDNTPARRHTSRGPDIARAEACARRRRRHPIRDHVVTTALGMVLGCLVAVSLIGLSFEGGPWGPGTAWNDVAFYPVMGGLLVTPVLMLVSLLVAARRPGFALFSLGYLSGVVVPLLF